MELRLAGDEGAYHVLLGKEALSKWKEYEGPEAGACQASRFRHSKEGRETKERERRKRVMSLCWGSCLQI